MAFLSLLRRLFAPRDENSLLTGVKVNSGIDKAMTSQKVMTTEVVVEHGSPFTDW